LDDSIHYLRSGTDLNHGIRYQSSLSGISIDGPMICDYNGGALAAESTNTNPDVVSLTCDWHGNVWLATTARWLH
jgi:hypothetical protein